MKESDKNQPQEFRLPPTWCASLCRNAMNEKCVENCAINRDCSGFEEKSNLKLIDMPRFPNTKNMSREERFTVVTVNLAKVVDHLNGADEAQNSFAYKKTLYRSASATQKVAMGVAGVMDDSLENTESIEPEKTIVQANNHDMTDKGEK